MKLVSVLFVTLVASSAMACPDMTGSWTCTSEQGTSNMIIAQEAMPGGAMYEITDDSGTYQLPADGVTRNYDQDGVNGSFVAACQGNTSVVGQETANYVNDGITMKVDFIYTLVNSNNLKGTINLVQEQIGGETQTGTMNFNCDKN